MPLTLILLLLGFLCSACGDSGKDLCSWTEAEARRVLTDSRDGLLDRLGSVRAGGQEREASHRRETSERVQHVVRILECFPGTDLAVDAASTLSEFGFLARAVTDTDEFTEPLRCAAAATPLLIRAVARGDEWPTQVAVAALGAIGDHDATVEEFQRLLRGPDWELVGKVIDTSGRMGRRARSLAPDLVELLRGDSDISAGDVEAALRRIEPLPAAWLSEALHDGKASVRRAAAAGAGHPAANALAFDVAVLLEDGDSSVRRAAAEALGAMSPDDARSLRRLGAVLRDPSLGVRVAAAHAALLLGRRSLAFLDDLRSVLRTEADESVLCYAIRGIGSIGSQAAAAGSDLETLARDPRQGVAWNAAMALVAIDPAWASRHVRVLGDSEESLHVRTAAAVGLGREGLVEGVDALVESLGSQHFKLAQAAIDSLRCIGVEAAPAAPALRKLSEDETADPALRNDAKRAYRRLRARRE